MKLAAQYLRTAAIALSPFALLAACASVGEPDAETVDRDGGGDASDGGTIDSDAAREDVGVDAGPCSTSKICRVAAPVGEEDRLLSLWGSGATDVWAVGTGGLIVHYDGARWEQAPRVGENDGAAIDRAMRGVWASARDDVWVVDRHRVRHSTGWKGPNTEWTFDRGENRCECTAVRGVGKTAWVAIDDYTAWMMRFEGADFESGPPEMLQAPPSDDWTSVNPTAVAVTNANEAWVSTYRNQWGDVKQAHVYRVSRADGTDGGASEEDASAPTWQTDEYDIHTKLAVQGIWSNEEAVWAVGERGMLLRVNRADLAKKSFENVASPVQETLYGVFGSRPNDIWAVGDASTVIHWDGTSWTKLTTPFDSAPKKPRLWAVWGSSSGDVWIVGDGTVLHYQENAP